MYHVQNLNYPIETTFQSRKEKLISLFLEEQRLNFTYTRTQPFSRMFLISSNVLHLTREGKRIKQLKELSYIRI